MSEVKKEQPTLIEGRWYWVKKHHAVPECALYGTKDGIRGFHLIYEDDKVYQLEDFELFIGEAINPALKKIYNILKKDIKAKLADVELRMLYNHVCRNTCVVEGCPESQMRECFLVRMKKNL